MNGIFKPTHMYDNKPFFKLIQPIKKYKEFLEEEGIYLSWLFLHLFATYADNV